MSKKENNKKINKKINKEAKWRTKVESDKQLVNFIDKCELTKEFPNQIKKDNIKVLIILSKLNSQDLNDFEKKLIKKYQKAKMRIMKAEIIYEKICYNKVNDEKKEKKEKKANRTSE
ncbi:hypothetical protein SAMN02745151_01459 [[Clostridium] propionicum DSM 1682]|uniref:Uncharacterized protein n=2 Tax=Anaerotignum propionicum TaxID=28446 RepID=A0A0X1U953_ANAPI|nr:hypothetical protein [Anaerotignum propionicum]AMJ41444.1 hypothetical protein CPRO_18620 [Anaerotignum propionicum DSM 1682]SHE68587.1 hypothetical protein SAMN02745151_01459 [[Clostridium] propionicum DSM 1682] [Anaerotignum propionicum DSM 1682]